MKGVASSQSSGETAFWIAGTAEPAAAEGCTVAKFTIDTAEAVVVGGTVS
jgi:hypothetical protein